MAFSDINPVPGLPLRTDRPPMAELSRVIRVLAWLLRPLILPHLRRSYSRAQERLSELMKAASRCNSRKELEIVLGAPAYALDGDGFGQEEPDGSMSSPDHVESYLRDRVVIDLWLRDNKAYAMSGFVMWSPWELAMNLPDELTTQCSGPACHS